MKEIDLLFNQMYELSNEGYKVIDTNFTIVSCNKKYAEFNNLENPQDIIGKKCSEYLCSLNCFSEKCSLLQILNGKKKVETIIEIEIAPNEIKYFILNIKPFFNKKNEIVGIIECFIDITAIKKNELALQESEVQLRKANATKDKLLSIIAHDLRSPFTNILGFSKLLIENVKYFKISEIEEHVRSINSSAEKTLTLLDSLLFWAKVQTEELFTQPRKLLLPHIIQEAIEPEAASANIKNISLNLSQTNKIEVCTDENMVKTILRNLISNAIKFTHRGCNINVSAVNKHDEIEITISDNGIGMNDETSRKLFNSSENMKSYGTEKESGSGLGLILCKDFVEKLGGRIWAESQEGKGSDFKFTLPLAPQDSVPRNV